MQKFVEAVDTAALREIQVRRDAKDFARRLARHCAEYRKPSMPRAVYQLLSTLVPFVATIAAMVWLADRAAWLVVLLAIPLGGLLVRLFIIQHDCGHGSFLGSRRANDAIGRAMSLFTFTPYGLWRRVHAKHHATSGNLDDRGAGDINTLTVREYLERSALGRLRYRVYRNPLFLFLLAVPAFFMIVQRLPVGHPLPFRETWKSVLGLDAAIAIAYGLFGWLVGLKVLLLIALPALVSPRPLVAGCFSFSTSSRTRIGRIAMAGISRSRPFMAAHIMCCRLCSTGSQAISACTISII